MQLQAETAILIPSRRKGEENMQEITMQQGLEHCPGGEVRAAAGREADDQIDAVIGVIRPGIRAAR